jgi:hypothetical protein
MTYNDNNITGYKPFMYDGVSPFISTKDSYLLCFQEGDPISLESLHTPYGKIKICCGYITTELKEVIYDAILTRIKGVFIRPYVLIIKNVDYVPIQYPLIKSRAYNDSDMATLYKVRQSDDTFNTYNDEIKRLLSLGIIEDDLNILNEIVDDQEYFDAIDKIFKLQMYSSEETNQFRKTARIENKYAHILGLLLLTDTPIKGITY